MVASNEHLRQNSGQYRDLFLDEICKGIFSFSLSSCRASLKSAAKGSLTFKVFSLESSHITYVAAATSIVFAGFVLGLRAKGGNRRGFQMSQSSQRPRELKWGRKIGV